MRPYKAYQEQMKINPISNTQQLIKKDKKDQENQKQANKFDKEILKRVKGK